MFTAVISIQTSSDLFAVLSFNVFATFDDLKQYLLVNLNKFGITSPVLMVELSPEQNDHNYLSVIQSVYINQNGNIFWENPLPRKIRVFDNPFYPS